MIPIKQLVLERGSLYDKILVRTGLWELMTDEPTWVASSISDLLNEEDRVEHSDIVKIQRLQCLGPDDSNITLTDGKDELIVSMYKPLQLPEPNQNGWIFDVRLMKTRNNPCYTLTWFDPEGPKLSVREKEYLNLIPIKIKRQ